MARVTLTVPAEHVVGVRSAILRELSAEAEGFASLAESYSIGSYELTGDGPGARLGALSELGELLTTPGLGWVDAHQGADEIERKLPMEDYTAQRVLGEFRVWAGDALGTITAKDIAADPDQGANADRFDAEVKWADDQADALGLRLAAQERP